MIWALLAILGVPIWLVVGALIGSTLARRRFINTPGVFAVRVRRLPSDDGKWSGKQHALWVHDVLLVNKGYAKVRTEAHGFRRMATAPRPLDAGQVKGLEQPVSFVLILDDGTEVEIAVEEQDVAVATGPYPWDGNDGEVGLA